MARKVYVSSDISVDEAIAEVAEEDALSALLWPWLLTSFDDWGRSEASPKRLKNKVFPGNALITQEIITTTITLLNKHGLITLYLVNGKDYMSIDPDKWFKWQTHIRSEKRENDKSKYPSPDNDDAQVREPARDNAEFTDNLTNCIPSPSPSLSLSLSLSPSLSKESTSISIKGENPFGLFQTHKFGKLDDISRDFIGVCIDDYTEAFVVKAITESVKQNKISWSYVERILKRWKETGHPEPWTLEKPEPPAQNNVRTFPNNNRPYGNRKKPLAVVETKSPTAERSEEERAAMRARAMQLDGNKEVR